MNPFLMSVCDWVSAFNVGNIDQVKVMQKFGISLRFVEYVMKSANIEYNSETLMLETFSKKQEGFTRTRKVPAKMMNVLMIQNMDQGYIKVVSLTVHFPTTLLFCRHLYILKNHFFTEE
jgi:hypothetical protein